MKIRVYRRPGSKVYQMDVWIGKRRFRKSAGTANERVANTKARAWVEGLRERFSAGGTEIGPTMAVDFFIDHCQRLGRAKLTVDGYRSRLKYFVAWVGDVDLREWTPDVARTKVDEYLTDRENAVKSVDHDRIALSVLFNFLKSKKWYKGENPANAKLHVHRKQPSTARMKPKRCTTASEDEIIRREGAKTRLWPVLLLTRWAGMRRGEACKLGVASRTMTMQGRMQNWMHEWHSSGTVRWHSRIRNVPAVNGLLVRAPGFEPGTNGLKIRCST